MRLLATTAVLIGGLGVAQAPPGYRILVASESGDIVTQLAWDGTALRTVKVVPVGIMPADIDGPHNVAVSPDGTSWYVTIAHGTPFGSLWKMAADGDTVVAKAPVEMFPTTIGLTPDGALAFVANSDFHGDHPRTNVVTIVQTATMRALTNLPACDMPHGVKVNHAGTVVYVSCMNSDEILEIDRQSFRIVRRHKTGAGSPQAMAGMHAGTAGATAPGAAAADCSPTFVSVSPDDRRLYVACNHGNTLQVLDAATLDLVKEIPVGTGAYNVEPSADGRWVIVTNKKAQSLSLVDAQALAEVARIPTSKKLPHGVAYAPDGRWAFISVESIGTDPGAVDVIDLTTRARVASAAVPLQPTGITILQRP
ncbi:MAG TPA: cytochrome D1 domain-containing protein [Gemmatimonadales bacterium]|jgi:YVTN family beta-propeller protein|nr:cytochrome D1 domain-containing protein [Gemmatimonadales bacterium]